MVGFGVGATGAPCNDDSFAVLPIPGVDREGTPYWYLPDHAAALDAGAADLR